MSAVLDATIEKPITVEDFYEIAFEGFRGELVRGKLKETMPTSILHGIIAGRIAGLLWVFLLQNKLGEVLTAETGFRLFVDEKTVRVPDVSFLSNEKLAEIKNVNKFYDGTPDLAVEVISPSETYNDVQGKLEDYLSAGVKMVWIIRPENKTVTTYRTLSDFKILRENEELNGDDVLPNFKCNLTDIFANLPND
ncbi:MAG TPA: Uma2 family endonuclease [Pyrinomonadaceae bacterium]|nr:Uma2 family endonuclease [Pyrinomonadaceae bacterium]